MFIFLSVFFLWDPKTLVSGSQSSDMVWLTFTCRVNPGRPHRLYFSNFHVLQDLPYLLNQWNLYDFKSTELKFWNIGSKDNSIVRFLQGFYFPQKHFLLSLRLQPLSTFNAQRKVVRANIIISIMIVPLGIIWRDHFHNSWIIMIRLHSS